MSQPVPPPSGNPFAGGDQFAPAPPPAPVRNNLGLGLAAGLAAAVVGALAYGGVMRALANEDGSYTEIGYAALAVGALVGFALGKVGGRNPILPLIGVPLALVAVFCGQLFGFALMISWWSEATPDPLTVTEILTSNLGDLIEGWKEEAEAMTYLFLGISGVAGYTITKKVAG
jgi:hypothetical protein